MAVDQIYNCYSQDMDKCGFQIDEQFLRERGLTTATRVRFTTDSFDTFDSESLAEIQEDC